jgi:MoxR-like ATPase
MLEAHTQNTLVGEKVGVQESKSVMTGEMLSSVMQRTKNIRVEDAILNAIIDLVRMTRPSDSSCPPQFKSALWYGAGPRAGLAIITACKAFALLQQSETVRWSHVRRMARPVMRHRLKLTAHAAREGMTEDMVVDAMLDRVQSDRGNQALGLE